MPRDLPVLSSSDNDGESTKGDDENKVDLSEDNAM